MISVFFEAIDAIIKKSNAEDGHSQMNLKILRKNIALSKVEKIVTCTSNV